MTNEEKRLLFRDLCVRLPYGVKCRQHKLDSQVCTMRSEYLKNAEDVEEYEPYLRPISSMTEEELHERTYYISSFEYDNYWHPGIYADYVSIDCIDDYIDWLNAHHFDYRGLIEKGLALEAPEGMYNN